jgi:hypothetical protein
MQDEPKEINLEAELLDHGANSPARANPLQKALATNNRFIYYVVFLFSAPKLLLNLCCYFFLPCSCTVDLQHSQCLLLSANGNGSFQSMGIYGSMG